MEKIEFVRSIDLFASLSDAEQAMISVSTRQQLFHAGDIVFREGDAGRTFYAVGRGTFSVWRGDPAREVAILRRGDYFGEMSLLTGEARTATIVALEESELIVFDRPVFMKLFAESVAVARTISDVVTTRQLELQNFAPSAPLAPEKAESAVVVSETLFQRIGKVFGF